MSNHVEKLSEKLMGSECTLSQWRPPYSSYKKETMKLSRILFQRDKNCRTFQLFYIIVHKSSTKVSEHDTMPLELQ